MRQPRPRPRSADDDDRACRRPAHAPTLQMRTRASSRHHISHAAASGGRFTYSSLKGTFSAVEWGSRSEPSPSDRLSLLLQRFSLTAGVSTPGRSAASTTSEARHPAWACTLHQARPGRGPGRHRRPPRSPGATLLFLPAADVHRPVADRDGADGVCASIQFPAAAVQPDHRVGCQRWYWCRWQSFAGSCRTAL